MGDGEGAVGCAFLSPRRRKILPNVFTGSVGREGPGGSASFSSTCLFIRYLFQAFSDLRAFAGTRDVAHPFSLVSTATLASRKTSSSFSTRKAQYAAINIPFRSKLIRLASAAGSISLRSCVFRTAPLRASHHS